MFKQMTLVLLVAVLSVTCLQAKEFSYKGHIWVWGRGTLTANGEGAMSIDIRGTASLTGSGTVDIPAWTRYRTEKSGWISVRRLKKVQLNGTGSVIVHCRKGKAVVVNGTVNASISGRGCVYLKGSGSYSSSSWKQK